MKKKVVGLGEVLWDLFPERTCLGGAPANFAYITTLMGDQGIVASRVGEDSRGVEALQRMEELGLNIDHVQTDREHPTGTVNVDIDVQGVARYEIAQPVAWDFSEWTLDWQRLAEKADAVCFGSLAQRSEKTRSTIRRFLGATSPATVRVFDVNLRQSYYSQEILSESMKLADIVKLNHEELPKIMALENFQHKDEVSSARRLIDAFDLKLVCVTRGGQGSLLVRDGDSSVHPGFRVNVADTVGSGDAFTAGLVHEYLHGASLALMNEVANLVGAWVASEVGAMPAPKRGALEHSLAEIR
ncbi:MAG TPA: carbohydrate kinase [Candidatus Sulfotelmatobacter sp.]|jgi:fructokinase|nr:carbohydrate kinase [Candidatus Sulfotelmatobacter sp.]